MPDFILSIDQGTTSTRAILFDLKGEQQGMAQRELPQIFPQAGWVEHDPEEIWRAVQQVCRDVMAKRPAGGVRAIGITNQRETMALWIALPVLRSHTTVVSRWLVMPMAAIPLAGTCALASARLSTETVARQISSASCSTQPGCG